MRQHSVDGLQVSLTEQSKGNRVTSFLNFNTFLFFLLDGEWPSRLRLKEAQTPNSTLSSHE
jgi:hypothetical protein